MTKTTKISKKKSKASIQKKHTKFWYLKFLPSLLVTVLATILLLSPYSGAFTNKAGVLAYATEMSQNGLLSATNAHRSANGRSSLSLNTKLINAAQAKANDMVARGYWSHITPDGQQPWVFVTNAGYQYLSAGENLAFGFSSSSATVNGWKASPSHNTNMLNSVFMEAGFGYANSSNYCYSGDHDSNPSTPNTNGCKGPQTIVVAMYGKPQGTVEAAQTPPASLPAQTTPDPVVSTKPSSPAPKPVETPAQQESPAEEKPKEEKKTEKETPDQPEPIATATTEGTAPPSAESSKVTLLDILVGGNSFLNGSLVIGFVLLTGAVWLIYRGFSFKRWLSASEKFIHNHIHLDMTVLSIIYLGFVLLSHSGTIH